ncbi:MAG: serine/threonine-protein kinase, partial [Myxococcota bacterium]
MEDRLLEFVEEEGLPPSLVPKLTSLISELGSGVRLPTVAATLDQAFPDRTPVDLSLDPDVPPPTAQLEEWIADRYRDLGPLGQGGVGEVRRVHDVALNRTLAMKTVRRSLLDQPLALARFLDEAQASAQLQHPNIVPVHDVGVLPDGRPWFTMREVRGRTLSDVIRGVHEASGGGWAPGPHGWTFRRLVSAFLTVCRAVAYAHERGVVHRDLKPANMMVGTQGEVYVLDWGLAKVVGRADLAGHGVRTSRISGDSDHHRTAMGRVIGT